MALITCIVVAIVHVGICNAKPPDDPAILKPMIAALAGRKMQDLGDIAASRPAGSGPPPADRQSLQKAGLGQGQFGKDRARDRSSWKLALEDFAFYWPWRGRCEAPIDEGQGTKPAPDLIPSFAGPALCGRRSTFSDGDTRERRENLIPAQFWLCADCAAKSARGG